MSDNPENEPAEDREYLEGHIEPESQKNEESTEKISFNPEERFDYQGNNGFEGERNNVILNFSYSPADLSVEERQNLINRGVSEEFFDGPVFRLDELRLTSSRNRFDYRQVMGDKVVVFFNPDKELDIDSALGDNIIFTPGDLTDLNTIAHLLHESGHLKKDEQEETSIYRRIQVGGREAHYLACLTENVRRLREKNEAQKALSSEKPLSIEQIRIVIENERSAWAFALTKLKPFLDSGGRQLIRERMHRVYLASYSERIRSKLVQEWKPVAKSLFDRIDKRKNS